MSRRRFSQEKWDAEARYSKFDEGHNQREQERLLRSLQPDGQFKALVFIRYTTKGWACGFRSYMFYYPLEEQAIAKGVELIVSGYARGFYGNPHSDCKK